MTLLLSLPTLFSPPRFPLISTTNPPTSWPISTSEAKAKPTFLCNPLHCKTTSFSSSSSSVVVDDDGSLPPPMEESSQLPFRGCKTCGKEEIEKGCNGEGRIQGGIATVPGFGWWPIKAYRPCPGFVASGGRYRRQGQSMDEVAFGRGGRETSAGSKAEVEARNKRRDPRRFKR